jgi:hypothetical protein
MTMTTGVVLVDDATQTRTAVAGFLAGYCGSTRCSYATDLRLFAAWCGEANVPLFGVRRAHLELFGRWMEERQDALDGRSTPVHPGQLLPLL